MTRQQYAIINRIAFAVGAGERQFQRDLGAEWIDAYVADWRTIDDTYEMLTAPDKPAVHLPAKMITGKGAPL